MSNEKAGTASPKAYGIKKLRSLSENTHKGGQKLQMEAQSLAVSFRCLYLTVRDEESLYTKLFIFV